MKTKSLLITSLCFCALYCFANQVHASLTISSGLGTTHLNNIVLNGSFENATFPTPAPLNGSGNAYFWANSSASPYVVPDSWQSTGGGDSAQWGNDGSTLPYRLKASDVLPDGRLAISFHTSAGATVNMQPTFQSNGLVTFAGTPTFTPAGNPPVTIKQTVHTELFPMPSYNLSFWLSGEEISTNQGFTDQGIIGLQMSNVLPGNPTTFLTVPNGLGSMGTSHLYEFTFTPINASLPVDIRFISWGGLNLTPWGGSPNGVQPILDDVIVNAVPEPSSYGFVIAVAATGLLLLRRRKSTS